MTLHDFLLNHEKEVIELTGKLILQRAGVRPSSDQLKQALPIFYHQLINVFKDAKNRVGSKDEEAFSDAGAIHGMELFRLGYTISNVVHSYGAICQAITELAIEKRVSITPSEFQDLNLCLDVAIAGAVSEYQAVHSREESSREVEHLGFLAHELRNALATVNISYELIKTGTLGFKGSTGRILEKGLKRIEDLIVRSLTEVRLKVDPVLHVETINLLQLIEQLIVTAEVEARLRKQVLEIQIDPNLNLKVDQQFLYSALSNLIQNAIKYTEEGGKIQVRAHILDENVVIEVEDECGGIKLTVTGQLFDPFVQKNENRSGVGLGLTIAQRAMALNHGTISVINLPGKGCIFRITLPRKPE